MRLGLAGVCADAFETAGPAEVHPRAARHALLHGVFAERVVPRGFCTRFFRLADGALRP